MLYNELKKLYYMNPKEEYSLVLHTSVLNFPKDILESIANEIPYQWIFPDNVYRELCMLKQSKMFGQQVEKVFELSRKRKGVYIKSNMEDFYDSQKFLVGAGASKIKKFIFVFGNQLKLNEFLKHVPSCDNYYVFFHNRWTHKEYSSDDMITKVENAKGWISVMDCERLTRNVMEVHQKAKIIENDARIVVKDFEDRYVGQYMVRSNVNEGGEANIYSIYENSEILLKIFKQKPELNRRKKIRYLMAIHQMNAHERKLKHVVFPENFIYEGSELLGVQMGRVKGRTLAEIISTEDFVDRIKLLRELALGIMELNLLGIWVVDLDWKNLMLDENGTVRLIDSDSFQVRNYSSGVVMSPEYRHADIVRNGCTGLYEPIHQDFAFEVFMFKLLVSGAYSPLLQKSTVEAASMNELMWGKGFEFPYKVNAYEEMEGKVNPVCLERWKGLPEELQKTFTEGFASGRTHSIGHIMYQFEEAIK